MRIRGQGLEVMYARAAVGLMLAFGAATAHAQDIPWRTPSIQVGGGPSPITLGRPVPLQGAVQSEDPTKQSLDVMAVPGFSGAPVCDGNGAVVGILIGKRMDGPTSAIPSSLALVVLAPFIAN